MNSPINFNDPTGHCADPLTAMLCGAALGFVINYGIQTYDNMTTKGMSFSEAVNWENINKKELVVATVGGAVAGLTMGLASGATAALIYGESTAGAAIAFTTEYIVGGALANVSAGQAQALTRAATNKYGTLDAKLSRWEILDKAKDGGLGDKDKIVGDAAIGAFTGTLSGVLSISSYGPRYGPQVIPKAVAVTTRVISDEIIEYAGQRRR